jgi:hypothetical protein
VSTTNVRLAEVWDEQVWRLAIGLRFVDGVRGGRPITDVRVAVEDVPKLHPTPRPGPLGVDRADPGIGLPTMTTRRSGRFAVLYPVDRKPPLHVRVYHPHGRYVARRLAIPFPALQEVQDEDKASMQPPAFTPVKPRGHEVALFPGATYEVSGTTGVRGDVFLPDGSPARWARVWATAPQSYRILGVAHADGQGQFLLLLRSTNALLGALPSLERELVLHAAAPPPTADSPGDPALDPLSALPVETLPPVDAPDVVSPGQRRPPGYTLSNTTPPVTCRMGRVVRSEPFTV